MKFKLNKEPKYTLDQIAIEFGADKSSLYHDYCKTYDFYMSQYRKEKINFLELGYGGYDDPNAGGESSIMWREYLEEAEIYINDVHDKNNIIPSIKFIKGPQQDPKTFENLPMFDVIVDDASHISTFTIASFKILWSKLKSGGLYFVEDLHSSYSFPYYKDANKDPEKGNTAMKFFKRMADEINRDFLEKKYHLGYDIESISFYRDLLVIKKK
jgi:hypothetical protein